jgi:hypothetical protein
MSPAGGVARFSHRSASRTCMAAARPRTDVKILQRAATAINDAAGGASTAGMRRIDDCCLRRSAARRR